MSHEPAPVTRTLARLMLRHQLGVRHDLLSLEAIQALEVEIARLSEDLGILPEHPVRRCGLGSSILAPVLIGPTDFGPQNELLAAAFLLDALAKDDPLSQVAGVDPADFHYLMCHWQEALGWVGQFHPLELMAGALERFLPEVMVGRWADLAQRENVDPTSIARYLLVCLEHAHPDVPEGPAFEWVDLANLVPKPSLTPGQSET